MVAKEEERSKKPQLEKRGNGKQNAAITDPRLFCIPLDRDSKESFPWQWNPSKNPVT